MSFHVKRLRSARAVPARTALAGILFPIVSVCLLFASGCTPGAGSPIPPPTQTGEQRLDTPSPPGPTPAESPSPMISPLPPPSEVALTGLLGKIGASPAGYAGKEVQVIGQFHGWDLLKEIQAGPPVTRSDWVIADRGGALYVTGLIPAGLDPASPSDVGTILLVSGTVRSNPAGAAYLEARQAERLEAWKIQFTLSGGLRGLNRLVELSSLGQVTVNDLRKKTQASVQLPDEDLAKLAGLMLQAAGLPALNRFSSCADCFEYRLDARLGRQAISLQANDISLADSGYSPLVSTLVDLQERVLSGTLK